MPTKSKVKHGVTASQLINLSLIVYLDPGILHQLPSNRVSKLDIKMEKLTNLDANETQHFLSSLSIRTCSNCKVRVVDNGHCYATVPHIGMRKQIQQLIWSEFVIFSCTIAPSIKFFQFQKRLTLLKRKKTLSQIKPLCDFYQVYLSRQLSRFFLFIPKDVFVKGMPNHLYMCLCHAGRQYDGCFDARCTPFQCNGSSGQLKICVPTDQQLRLTRNNLYHQQQLTGCQPNNANFIFVYSVWRSKVLQHWDKSIVIAYFIGVIRLLSPLINQDSMTKPQWWGTTQDFQWISVCGNHLLLSCTTMIKDLIDFLSA